MPVPIIFAITMIFRRFGKAIWKSLQDPETRGLVYLTFGVVFTGTVFYRIVEGWNWVDSFYFTIITLTTVGYGDFSPKTTGGKLFTVVFILVGLSILASFIALIASYQNTTQDQEQAE